MKTATVTIITVNYNTRASIEKSIQALNDSIIKEHIRYIVVDNSDDQQLANLIESKYSKVQYFSSLGNIGFGRGCNIGLEHVDTHYCLLLNPDAFINMTDLETMLSFMDTHSNVAFLGPCIHEPDGTFQMAGGLPTPYDIIKVATGFGIPCSTKRKILPGNRPFKTDWLSGAIVLVRMKALDEIGFFDPRYFLYFEETDLCRRLLNADWEIWATGEAEGFHEKAGSTSSAKKLMYFGCIAEHYFQSRFYYMVKHYGWFRAIISDVIEYTLAPVRWVYQFVRRKNAGERYITRLRSPLLSLPKRKV